MSFFKSRSASASTASLRSENLGPKTTEILTLPHQESSVKKKWEYDGHQLDLVRFAFFFWVASRRAGIIC